MIDKKNIVLIIAGLLILIGLIKPDLSRLIPSSKPTSDTVVVNLEAPSDEAVRKECDDIISIVNGNKADGTRLRDLFIDLSDLIALDQENEVIRNTEEIKQANSLAGIMLKLDIKGKYENLAKESKDVIVSVIGDDSVPLSAELRSEAVKAFRYLAWAYDQGAK
jgi:hypothetical protein